jgi:hypothetical protein
VFVRFDMRSMGRKLSQLGRRCKDGFARSVREMIRASGWRAASPGAHPSEIGNLPTSAAKVVIMIGRKRSRQASRIATCADRPRVRCASSAKSIIMMAFFFTIPISTIRPRKANTFSSVPKISSVRNAPRGRSVATIKKT